MKRSICLLLCVVLTVFCFDLMVFADETVPYGVIVGNRLVTETEADVFDDGTVSYDAEASVLTLNGWSYLDDGVCSVEGGVTAGITVLGDDHPLTIVVNGANTIVLSESDVPEHSCGIYSKSPIKFEGDGELSVNATNAIKTSYGVMSDKEIILSSGKLTFVGGEVDKADSSGDSAGIMAKTVTINGGEITAIGSSAYERSCGINAYDLVINGGTVTATGGESDKFSLGIRTETGFTMKNGTVNATSAGNSYNSYAIHVAGSSVFNLLGGEISAIAGKTNVTGTSSGIRVANTVKNSRLRNVTIYCEGRTYGYDCSYGPTVNGGVNLTATGEGAAYSTAVGVLGSPKPKYENATYTILYGQNSNALYKSSNPARFEYRSKYLIVKTVSTEPELPYDDIERDMWYTEAVLYCTEHGFLSGTGDRTFSPELSMTRAMFVQMLAKVAGVDLSAYGNEQMFDDVALDQWYSAAVEWAVEVGVTAGVGDGRFAPDMEVTRQQMAVFFRAYARMCEMNVEAMADISAYDDADSIAPWAVDAMRWVVECDIMSGTTATTLSPETVATRAQVAVMTMKLDLVTK